MHKTAGRDPEAGVAGGLLVPTMSLGPAGGATAVRVVLQRRGMPNHCRCTSVPCARLWPLLYCVFGIKACALAQRFPTPKSLATETARQMARPNGAPMPSGCAGASCASRAGAGVVVCSSRSDALYMERVLCMVMWQKSPQATVGTRGRVISPCA